MEKGDQTGVAGILIGFFLAIATMMWPWAIPDETRHIFVWTSAGFVLAGCLWLLDLHFLSKRLKIFRLATPGISVIMLLTIIVRVEWPSHQASVNNPLDDQIAFSCEWSQPPSEYRADKNTYLYELGDPPTFGGMPEPYAGALTFFASGSGPIPPIEKKTYSNFVKCTAQNFSDSSLLGVQVVLSVSFREKVMTGATSYKSGATIANRLLSSPPLDLGPSESQDSSDYFYIWNPTPYFADAPVPSVVSFKMPGTLESIRARLLPPESSPFIGLFPDPNR